MARRLRAARSRARRPSATSSRSSRCSSAGCRAAAPCSRSRAAPASTSCTSRARCPRSMWQPTDADPELRAAIAARVATAALDNLLPPLPLDVLDSAWPVTAADAVLCINMIHIAPRAATPALLRGSARLLRGGAPLILYGPYRRGGRHTAASNEAFDASLRARNPDWGVRDLDERRGERARPRFRRSRTSCRCPRTTSRSCSSAPRSEPRRRGRHAPRSSSSGMIRSSSSLRWRTSRR